MYRKRKRSIQPNNKAPRRAPLFGSSFSFVIMVTCRKNIFLTLSETSCYVTIIIVTRMFKLGLDFMRQ